jgi:CHASE2 domain-containing sensor protein
MDPGHVYIGLAVALALWMAFSTLTDRQRHLKTSTYDWMLTHRFRVPAPDPDIVLLDIDERSLAVMAEDYGRWPWPRDVLATVLAGLEGQGAKAVVFDILFSDADRQNPVSDRAFADAIAESHIAYFPVLRLNPENDARSAVRADQLPGLAVPLSSPPGGAAPPTLAVVLPYFDSALRSGRLGTHNVEPDADSLIRRYRLWEDVDGYRVLSLPARMALDFGWRMPDRTSNRLQFNERVMAYRTVSFADVFMDMQHRQRTRPVDEFRGKIVVIGSTASGLFDLKGTAISRTDPGIDILATAIDNTKNDRFFHELSPVADAVLAALLLVLMPWLCIRYSHEQLRLAFLLAPIILLGISYLSINVSNTFIDLTAPASMAFLYFSAVKFYSAQVRRRWAGDTWFAPVLQRGASHWIACLAATLPLESRVKGFETLFLNLLRVQVPNVRMTPGFGAQSGWLGRAYAGVLVASWVERSDDAPAIQRDRAQARALLDGLGLLRRGTLPMEHQFDEEVVAGAASDATEGLADSLKIGVRGLVSRTVLRMTEGRPA